MRHSQDRQEGLQSQDAECCPQQDAGLGMVLPPHVPSPEARLPPSCSSVSPQAAEGAPGEGVNPLSSPKERGVRPWSCPSLTETS